MTATETIQIKEISELSLLKEHPELILKMLTPLEYELMQILYHEMSGLTARGIQREIALDTYYKFTHKLIDVPLAEGINRIKTLKGKKLKMPGVKERKDPEIEALSTVKLIERARNALGVQIPSNLTIENNLDNLHLQGLVGRRMFPEEKKPSFVFFMNPVVYVLLKDVEKKYLENKDDSFYEMWSKFFFKRPKSKKA